MGVKENLYFEHPEVIPQPFPITVVREGIWKQKGSLDAFDDE